MSKSQFRTNDEVNLSSVIPSLKGSRSDKPVTMEQLQSCYRYLAELIQDGNNDVLPLFERFHKEIENRKKDQHMKQIALSVAQENQKQSK